MKILILQLARFGDIYCSWPVLHALKRKYPQSTIEFIVRKSFASATVGLEAICAVKEFDSQRFLEPLSQGNRDGAAHVVDEFCTTFQVNYYDLIINLTFSPLSSYLVSLIKSSETQVKGYHRWPDGHLNLPDAVSAYFYSQVGIGRSNRFHVTEIFAALCDVALIESDWAPFSVDDKDRRGVVVHFGASQNNKKYSQLCWRQVIEKLQAQNIPITLIGSCEESVFAEQIAGAFSNVRNLVGKTSLSESIEVISHSKLLVGADSAPVHMATLSDTPVINLSFSSVNLFETGPRSRGSRILLAKDSESLASERVVGEIMSLYINDLPVRCDYYVDESRNTVSLCEFSPPLEWQVIEFLYFGKKLPLLPQIVLAALKRLKETTQVALINLNRLEKYPSDKTALEILNRCVEIFEVIKSMSTVVSIVVKWFEAMKIQIGPNSFTRVLAETKRCYEVLESVLDDILDRYDNKRTDDGTQKAEQSRS